MVQDKLREIIKMKIKKGFTLIELLVVISIIALLLAILMPALGKVKAKAQAVVCGTNLKQYGMAGTMYTSENDDMFPQSWYWLISEQQYPSRTACTWHDPEFKPNGQLWPYLANEDVHVCSTFRQFSKTYGPDHGGHDTTNSVFDPVYSYSMNGYLGKERVWGTPASEPKNAIAKSSRVKRTSEVMYFTEEGLVKIPDMSITVLNDTVMLARFYPLTPDSFCDAVGGFHSMKGKDMTTGKANIVFVDGHVDSGLPKDSFKLSYPFGITDEMDPR